MNYAGSAFVGSALQTPPLRPTTVLREPYLPGSAPRSVPSYQGTITYDTSAPAEVRLTNSTAASTTTASFSPPAGSLVVIKVGLGYNANTPTGPTMTVTDSLGNAYTLGQSAYDGAASGAYIFSRYYASAPGAITVTVARSVTTAAMFGVRTRVLLGAAATQTGAATSSAANVTGVSLVTAISPTAVNSNVEAALAIGSNLAVVPVGLTTDTSWQDSADGTALAWGHKPTEAPSAASLGWQTPSSASFWALAALEILPAPVVIPTYTRVQGNSNVVSVAGTTKDVVLTNAATTNSVLVINVTVDKTSGTMSMPAGWTKVNEAVNASVSTAQFWKASAGETAGTTFTVTHATSAAGGKIEIEEWKSNATGAWTQVAAGATNSDGVTTTTSQSATSTGLSAAHGIAFAMAGKDTQGVGDNATWTGTGTWDEQYDPTGDTQPGLWVATQPVLGSGNTFTATCTTSGSADQMNASVLVLSQAGGLGGGSSVGAAVSMATQSTLVTGALIPNSSVSLTSLSTLNPVPDQASSDTYSDTYSDSYGGSGPATVSAAASLSSTSTLTTAALRDQPSAVTMSSASSFPVSAVRDQPSSFMLFATSSFPVSATRDQPSTVALSAVSTLTPAATKTVLPGVSLVSTSALTAATFREQFAAAALVATSTLTSAATTTGVQSTAAVLAAVSTLNASAFREQFGAVPLTSSSTLTSAVTRVQPGAVSLTSSSALTTATFRQQFAAVALTSALVLNALPSPPDNFTDVYPTSYGTVTLLSTSTLGAAAAVTGVGAGAAALTATSTMTVSAVKTVLPAVSLTGLSTLTSATFRQQFAVVGLSSVSTLTAATFREQFNTVTLPAASTLTANAGGTTSGVVTMTAASSLGVTGFEILISVAALSSTSTLSTAAVRDRPSVVALAATSALTSATFRQQFAVAALVASSVLGANAGGATPAAVSLASASTMTVATFREQFVSVSLANTSTLTTGLTRTTFGTVALSATSTLAVTSFVAVAAAAALSNASSLTVNTQGGVTALVPLTTVSVLAAGAVREKVSVVSLNAYSFLAVPVVNLFGNPMASINNGWQSNNGTFWTRTVDTVVFRSSPQAIRHTKVVGTTNTAILSMYAVGMPANTRFQAAAGSVLTFSAFVYAGQAGYRGRVSIAPQDAGGAQVGATLYGPYVDAPAGTWVRVSGTFTVPVGATQFWPGLYVETYAGLNGGDGDWAVADDAMLTEGPVLWDFDAVTGPVVREQPTTVSLQAGTTLSVGVTRASVSAAALVAATTLATAPVRERPVAVSLSANGTITVTSVRERPAGVALASAGTLAVNAPATVRAAFVVLTAMSSLLGTGVRTRPASVAMQGAALLTVFAHIVTAGDISPLAFARMYPNFTYAGIRENETYAVLEPGSTV